MATGQPCKAYELVFSPGKNPFQTIVWKQIRKVLNDDHVFQLGTLEAAKAAFIPFFSFAAPKVLQN
jgi:hypothetical protein